MQKPAESPRPLCTQKTPQCSQLCHSSLLCVFLAPHKNCWGVYGGSVCSLAWELYLGSWYCPEVSSFTILCQGSLCKYFYFSRRSPTWQICYEQPGSRDFFSPLSLSPSDKCIKCISFSCSNLWYNKLFCALASFRDWKQSVPFALFGEILPNWWWEGGIGERDGARGGMGRGRRGSKAAGAEKGWERQRKFLPFGFSFHWASCASLWDLHSLAGPGRASPGDWALSTFSLVEPGRIFLTTSYTLCTHGLKYNNLAAGFSWVGQGCM